MRILATHPGAALRAVGSRQHAGEPLARVWPSLAPLDLVLDEDPMDPAVWVDRGVEVVFAALPHGTFASRARAYIEAGMRVVDLSADFRLRDPQSTSGAITSSTRHLPPRQCDLRPHRMVRAGALQRLSGGQPRLLRDGDPPRIVAGGGGRMVERRTDRRQRSVGRARSRARADIRHAFHRMRKQRRSLQGGRYPCPSGRDPSDARPEWRDGSDRLQSASCRWHAASWPIAIPLKDPVDVAAARALRGQIRRRAVRAADGRRHTSETRHVRGSNGCHLALRVAGDGKLLLVFAAIDNLMKGAAGQAIQVEPDVGLARGRTPAHGVGMRLSGQHPARLASVGRQDRRPPVRGTRRASDWRAPAPPSRPRSSSCMAAAAR